MDEKLREWTRKYSVKHNIPVEEVEKTALYREMKEFLRKQQSYSVPAEEVIEEIEIEDKAC